MTPGEDSRASRGELAIVLGLALVALVLRLGRAAAVPFYEWDSGFLFARIAEDLGTIAAGHAESQYGAAHPVYNMMGFSVVVRVVRDALGLSTESAGQLVVLVAATLLVPLAWALARRLGGPRAGCLAAALVALDPREIEASVQALNVLPCAALVAASALLLQRGRVAAALAAGVLVGLAAGLRADALAAGAVLAAYALWSVRRGELSRRAAILFLVASTTTGLAIVLVQRAVMAENGAADYLTHVHADALYIAGRYREAYFADATGLTLRIASEPPSWRAWDAALVVRQVGGSLLACAQEIGGLLSLALLGVALLEGRARATAAWLVALAVALPAFTVAALAPPTDMWRYTGTSRPLVVAVIAAGAVGALERARRTKTGANLLRSPTVPVTGVLCLLLAVWPPTSALGLLDSGSGARARATTCARDLARILPPRARVARGPGGDPVIVSLAGGRPVHLAVGPTPDDVVRYLRGNGLEWIVYDEKTTATLARILPGVRLEPVATYEANGGTQVVARIR